MPVLSSKSRDFLGSIGPVLGAGALLSEIASDVAQFLGGPSLILFLFLFLGT